MEFILQIIIGLGSVGLIGAWFLIVFNYPALENVLGLSANKTEAMGMIRGDIAGMLLLIGVFQGLFLLYGNIWALPAIMATGAVTIGRSFSLIFDGYSRMNLAGIMVELVGITSVYLLWKDLV